jgi:hypothetical protein
MELLAPMTPKQEIIEKIKELMEKSQRQHESCSPHLSDR